MAQAISLQSNPPFIGSPIIFSVTPNEHRENYTFHTLSLSVIATLVYPDEKEGVTAPDYTTIGFSVPVDSNLPITIDISSALQAVADAYTFRPQPPSRYPYLKFRIEVYDEWMDSGRESGKQGFLFYPERFVNVTHSTETFYVDGEPHEVDATNTEYKELFLYAFLGSLTDIERLRVAGKTQISVNRWTRKPTSSPEIVFVGLPVILPKYFPTTMRMDAVDTTDIDNPVIVSGAPDAGPMSRSHIASVANRTTIFDDGSPSGYTVYAILPPKDAIQLRFVNGMNCLESVHLSGFSKKEVSIQTDRYIVDSQETPDRFSRFIAIKNGNREKWVLTSPPLDEQWASWYIHELLTARWAWIAVTGIAAAAETWIPVIILPEETTTLIDRAKGGTTTVQITVELGVDGSPIL